MKKQLTVRSARLQAVAAFWQWLGVRSSQHHEVESHSHSQVCSIGLPLRPTPPQLPGDPGYMPHAETTSNNIHNLSCSSLICFLASEHSFIQCGLFHFKSLWHITKMYLFFQLIVLGEGNASESSNEFESTVCIVRSYTGRLVPLWDILNV